SAKIAGGAATPKVRGEAAAGCGYLARDLDDDFRFDSAFLFGELRGKAGIVLSQCLDRRFKTLSFSGESVDLQILPVRPILYERGIEPVLIEDEFRHGQQNCRFCSGIG